MPPGETTLRFTGNSSEDVTFVSPKNSLTINTSGNGNVVQIGAQAADFAPSMITLNGSSSDTFTLTAAAALPAASAVTLNAATLNLNGNSTTISGLTGNGNVTNTAGGNTTLTVNGSDTFSGSVQSVTIMENTTGYIDQPYTQTLPANGTQPSTFSVNAALLPSGLTLDGATGIISGTPTVLGASQFTVTVTDANGNSTSLACTIDVIKTTPVLTVVDASGIYTGLPFTATVAVDGATSLQNVTPTIAYYDAGGIS